MNVERMRWIVGWALLVFLFLGAYVVLQPFLSPLAWAGVLCFTTWPLYRFLLHALGSRDVLAASVMTGLLLVAVALPVLLASWMLVEEVQTAYAQIGELIRNPKLEPPAWVVELPALGPILESGLARWREDPQAIQQLLLQRADSFQDVVLATAGRLGRNVIKVGLTLFTLFFFYRYGEDVVDQVRKVASRFIGERAHQRMQTIGLTIRAVVYGLLLTAAAQGILAFIGYWVAGVPAPVLLGATTGFLALIPFGAPFVWLPAGVWVLINQSLVWGMGLLVWGAVVVSGIDNILRPLFISGATRIPYLLVFFGVLGGVSAFGLIGLFVGPTILSVLLALWREWIHEALPEIESAEAGSSASA